MCECVHACVRVHEINGCTQLDCILIFTRDPSYTDPIMISLEGGGLCTRYVNYVN